MDLATRIQFCLVRFYGLSTIVGYLCQILFLHVFKIYAPCKCFVDNILKQAWALLLHTVKWFQILLYNNHNLTSAMCLRAHIVCSIWPIDRTQSGATSPGQSGPRNNDNEAGIPHSPNLQGWSLAIWWFNVISGILVRGGGLPLHRYAVSVFYSHSWLSYIHVQILNEAVCISYCANTVKNGMNPTILPPAMDK